MKDVLEAAFLAGKSGSYFNFEEWFKDNYDLLNGWRLGTAKELHTLISHLETTDAYENGVPMSDLFEDAVINPIQP